LIITKIRLENIKSHVDTTIKFSEGVNAILGANGSGKSTALEAIGTVLFQSLDYKHSQFIREGEKKGKITITITKDDETFNVVRVLGSSAEYYVECNGARLVENKEEVVPFLKDNFGIDQTADLPRLFQDVIGVPQGSHTSHFLLPTAARKTIFEPIMNVEHYAVIRKMLLPVFNLAKQKKQDVEDTLNNLQGQVIDYNQLKVDETGFESELGGINKLIKTASLELTTARDEKVALELWKASNEKAEHIKSSIETYKNTKAEYNKIVDKAVPMVAEFERLKPLVEKQLKLEDQTKHYPDLKYKRDILRSTLIKLNADTNNLESNAKDYKASLSNYEEVSIAACKHGDCESEYGALNTMVDGIDARLGDLEIYRDNAKDGICPILKISCSTGGLKDAFDNLITDLETESEKLHKHICEANKDFKTAKDAIVELRKLNMNKEKIKGIEEAIVNNKESIKEHESELKEIDKEINRLNKLIEELNSLENPKSKSDRVSNSETTLTHSKKLVEDTEYIIENLITEYKALIESGVDGSQEALDGATTAYRDLMVQSSVLKEKHSNAANRLCDVQTEIGDRKSKMIQIKKLKRESSIKSSISKLISDVRDMTKEIPERLVEQHLHHINYDANILFNEITGRHTDIDWSSTYELSLGGKTFSQLSGGEQMVSALAVRLALLKNLTDINLVIFDEPTTNLDEERRAGLAEMIGNITGFTQLFVISHDDTFDNVIDNVIHLEKVGGISQVI